MIFLCLKRVSGKYFVKLPGYILILNTFNIVVCLLSDLILK